MYCFCEYNCRLWGVRGLNIPSSAVDPCANCKTQYLGQLYIMYDGKLVFSQVMDFIPWHTFRRCVKCYDDEHRVHSFRCTEQYRCMAFAQLTYRESLRDIETCQRAHSHKLPHMGIVNGVSTNTLANANKMRDWRIYADFAQRLIHTARNLYADQDHELNLDNTVYALDSSTIDLCLSLFPWAPIRSTKAAVKLHTLLDLRGNIPAFIHIYDSKLHDVNILDQLLPEIGAFYIMDRAYLEFSRLHVMNQNRQLLRTASQVQYQVSANLFAQGGSFHRRGLRSDRQVVWYQQYRQIP